MYGLNLARKDRENDKAGFARHSSLFLNLIWSCIKPLLPSRRHLQLIFFFFHEPYTPFLYRLECKWSQNKGDVGFFRLPIFKKRSVKYSPAFISAWPIISQLCVQLCVCFCSTLLSLCAIMQLFMWMCSHWARDPFASRIHCGRAFCVCCELAPLSTVLNKSGRGCVPGCPARRLWLLSAGGPWGGQAVFVPSALHLAASLLCVVGAALVTWGNLLSVFLTSLERQHMWVMPF